MAYTPYYSGGWQSGEEGGTPITPAALNNMESGISGAFEKTGGPMTGAIVLDTGDDYTTAPPSNDYNAMHTARDTGSVVRGGMYSARYPSGRYATIIATRSNDAFASFGPALDQSGNVSYIVDTPTALLDALGVKWTPVTGPTSAYGGIGLGLDATRYMVVGAYAATASGTNYIVSPFVGGGGTAWNAKVENFDRTAVASTSVTLYVAYIDFGAGNIS